MLSNRSRRVAHGEYIPPQGDVGSSNYNENNAKSNFRLPEIQNNNSINNRGSVKIKNKKYY